MVELRQCIHNHTFDRKLRVCPECRREAQRRYQQRKKQEYIDAMKERIATFELVPTSDTKTVARELTALRQAMGTQAEVAMQAGVNAWTFQHRELNMVKNLNVLQRHAKSLGIELLFSARRLDTDE